MIPFSQISALQQHHLVIPEEIHSRLKFESLDENFNCHVVESVLTKFPDQRFDWHLGSFVILRVRRYLRTRTSFPYKFSNYHFKIN